MSKSATKQSEDADTNPPGKDEKLPPLSAREEWTEFGKTAVIAILLALIIRALLFEPFNIPSGSMKPNLLVGDYLFVNKPAYGYSRYSFPFGLAPIRDRVWAAEPQRGDVIVFKLPTNPSIDYIKRIVAMPGETVQVINGRLHINNVPVEREQNGLQRIRARDGFTTVMEYTETLPGGVSFSIYEEGDQFPLDDTPPFIVPVGHYFVMGDNRDNSQDSRVQSLVGFVPFRNIVGRADFLFFSIEEGETVLAFWKWPWTIRFDRLFDDIDPVRPQADDVP